MCYIRLCICSTQQKKQKLFLEAVTRLYFVQKVFLKFLQISQENTWVGVFFNKVTDLGTHLRTHFLQNTSSGCFCVFHQKITTQGKTSLFLPVKCFSYIQWLLLIPLIRGGSRAAATSKMERFVIIVNGCTKRSILDVAVALDPPLLMM